MLKEYLGKSPQ